MSAKERMSKEARKFIKDLFKEQNWTGEKFDKDSLKTVTGLAYWLEYFFDMYEAISDDFEEKAKYEKAIRLIIRELENIDEE